jgi:hypothetical protein
MDNKEKPAWEVYGPIRKVLTAVTAYIYFTYLMGMCLGYIDRAIIAILIGRGYTVEESNGPFRFVFFFYEVYMALFGGS